MCGICGIIDSNSGNKVSGETLRRMCGALRHRGPDDEGVYIDGVNPSVGLGHRRLSIIDLSPAGHQPMSNEDGSIWLVLNGEIYNYKELREEMEGKGHVFRSHTDTETVLHLYEEYGEDCVRYLRGMFAFALWDEKKKTALLVRDRVGKKPLLYHYANGALSFSSEFESLLQSGLIKKEINYDAINYYLTFGYIPSPFTIYKNVFKLSPAERLLFKNGKIGLERYWELDYSKKISISEEDAAEEVLRLLKEATGIRLYSDVPLGAFLSGGIDSSVVVAVMSEISPNRVKTFSIGFEEAAYDELRYARNIAKMYNTEHNEFVVKPKATDILPLLVERYGEPYADSSCIPTYYVSKQTKQYVTVALNGDGGDESFAGYERYQAMAVAEAYQHLPRMVKKTLAGVSKLLPDSIDPRNRLRNIKRFVKAVDLETRDRYVRWVGVFDNDLKHDLYSDDFKGRISLAAPAQHLGRWLGGADSGDILDRLLRTDTGMYLPDDLLVKVDIASMANSLEARSPFLDHKLMEFAAQLPAEYKMKRLVKKYILKKAIKGLVPDENVRRRKMGFGVPVGEWFRKELKDFLRETLLSEKALSRGYFNKETVKSLVRQHVECRADYRFQLWALLMLELWHNRFID